MHGFAWACVRVRVWRLEGLCSGHARGLTGKLDRHYTMRDDFDEYNDDGANYHEMHILYDGNDHWMGCHLAHAVVARKRPLEGMRPCMVLEIARHRKGASTIGIFTHERPVGAMPMIMLIMRRRGVLHLPLSSVHAAVGG